SIMIGDFMKKKVMFVLMCLSLLTCVFYLTRSVFNFISILEVSSQYPQSDFIPIISRGVAYLGFMITFTLLAINLLYIVVKINKWQELLTKTYKPITQIVSDLAIVCLAFVVYYLFNTS